MVIPKFWIFILILINKLNSESLLWLNIASIIYIFNLISILWNINQNILEEFDNLNSILQFACPIHLEWRKYIKIIKKCYADVK